MLDLLEAGLQEEEELIVHDSASEYKVSLNTSCPFYNVKNMIFIMGGL